MYPDIIYYKLKSYVYSQNKDIKNTSLETICYLAKYMHRKEQEISELILEQVDPTDNEHYSVYAASSFCLNEIKNNVKSIHLRERINNFQIMAYKQ